MDQIKHSDFLKEAIEIAFRARQQGNHPFGAVLVFDNQIILTSANSVVTENDVTRHAELNLVSEASRQFSQNVINRCTLYSSAEPCVMCSGAIYWSGIRKVFFALSCGELEVVAGKSLLIESRDVFSRGIEQTEIIGPFLEEEAIGPHKDFW